jgi:hypothetical protein
MLQYVEQRMKSVFWSSMARHGWSGMLQYGIRASVFNTEPGWAEQVELKKISQRIYFEVAKFHVAERPW